MSLPAAYESLAQPLFCHLFPVTYSLSPIPRFLSLPES
jgi:hypothetical protein